MVVAGVRQSATPVLEPNAPWEGIAVMCPHVIWDSLYQALEDCGIPLASSMNRTLLGTRPALTDSIGTSGPPTLYWRPTRIANGNSSLSAAAAQIIHWKGWVLRLLYRLS